MCGWSKERGDGWGVVFCLLSRKDEKPFPKAATPINMGQIHVDPTLPLGQGSPLSAAYYHLPSVLTCRHCTFPKHFAHTVSLDPPNKFLPVMRVLLGPSFR